LNDKIIVAVEVGIKGGSGSGNWGHTGRPGLVGGSGGRAGAGMFPPGTPGVGKYDDKRATDFLNSGMPGNWSSATEQERVMVKQELVEALSDVSGVDIDAVNDVVGQWAITSNDTDMRSLSLQEAAAKEFGLELSDWQKDAITEINQRKVLQTAAQGKPLLPRDQERAIIRAMHTETQAMFDAQGLKPTDTITLFRGVNLPSSARAGWTFGEAVDYQGNAIESWTVSKHTASGFGFSVVSMDVPVSNIVATARTGFGCLREGEFVILGSIPGQQVRVVSEQQAAPW
jgi:hypothetical protein